MKKTTQNNFSNRLLKYGALSAAIAGVADANGQVVYTDIADVTIDGTSPSYALDLDNDASGEYLLRVQPNSSGGGAPTDPAAFVFPATGTAYNANGIVGASISSYQYPSNLSSGQVISSGNTLMAGSARGDMNWNSCAYPNSQFCGGTDAFMGFHFQIGGNTHYGWARVQVAANPLSMIIKDYAYNATAGASIAAGQTLGVVEDKLSNIKIVTANNTIALHNLPSQSTYKLFSVTGQVTMQGATNNDSYIIEANTLSSGIYIIEIEDTNTNRTIKKKLVL
jgi:hypothetical protein